MSTEVGTDVIDSQFSNGEPTQFDAGDIFDQAKDHFFSGARDVEQQGKGELGEVSEDSDTSSETDSTSTEQTDGQTGEQSQTANESDFKSYEFKGQVFGKDIAQKFESPEQLNKVIARGLASETIYKRLKERETQIQELSLRAESGDQFENMAKTDPQALVDLVFDKYLTEEQAAKYTLGKFEHFRNLAKMTPEERERERKLKLADRLLQERDAADKAQQLAKTEQQKLQFQREIEDEKNWANQELRRTKLRFDKLEDSALKDQILNVISYARLAKQQGSPMTLQQMSAKLQQYLKPFEKLTSPAETRRKIGETIDQKKKEATTNIQNAARSQIPSKSNSGNKIPDNTGQDEIFDMIREQVRSGKLKIQA